MLKQTATFLFGSLLTFLSFNLNGQEKSFHDKYMESTIEEKSFDKEHWQEVTRDLTYPPEHLTKEEKARLDSLRESGNDPYKDWERHSPNSIQSPKSRRSKSTNVGFISGLGNLLIYLVVILLVGFLLYMIINYFLNKQAQKLPNKPIGQITELFEEEHIEESDLDKRLAAALASKNFKVAIRIKYLMVLQLLSKQRKIIWKKDKTNLDYVLETKGSSFGEHFRDLTNVFERVWYSEMTLNEVHFDQMAGVYDLFLNEMRSKR